ncbi:hypothetical protein [Synechococcus sp. RSCCF101]|uniref:hypothetical protein n=1 Tax=Synechococcus sp. RSCCF101 TaxID=2511069 RepID=UPI001CD99D92|nr:hypothetical protein [Synechococcus sp. RSCCF101]
MTFSAVLRRERANAIASALAGWLDQTSRSAPNVGQTCTVTISTGQLSAGDVLASVTPAGCAQPATLTVPDFSGGGTARVAATPDTFFFTPRATIATAGNANPDVLLRMSVADQPPLRCIRLTGALGILEIGRNTSASSTRATCDQWNDI